MRVQIIYNHSQAASQQVQKQLSEIIQAATYAVEADAKKRAPVDTGALRNSIQSSFPTPKTGVVSASVEYAPYVELGTIHNKPQPFLFPALKAVKPMLRARLAALGAKLK
jgi:HK97 gp10 family phage protein